MSGMAGRTRVADVRVVGSYWARAGAATWGVRLLRATDRDLVGVLVVAGETFALRARRSARRRFWVGFVESGAGGRPIALICLRPRRSGLLLELDVPAAVGPAARGWPFRALLWRRGRAARAQAPGRRGT
jgi:hypothetical protein